MPKDKKHSLPLDVLLELMLNREGTKAVTPLIKTDKRTPSVRSIYNIPYTFDTKNRFLQFDWHCPAHVAEKILDATAPTVFYIHGGAWSSGDKKLYSRLSKDIAEQGYIVVNLNFRYLPEHNLATHYHDCAKCIGYCLNKAELFGIDRNRLFIAGDSSGANMAALIGGRINANKFKISGKLAGLLLFYGIYDLNNLSTVDFHICNTLHKGFEKIKGAKLSEFYRIYSPVTYISKDYPPCFITAGKVDGLHTESIMFAEKLKNIGVQTSTLIFPENRKDARHAFINLNGKARAEALETMFEFMEKVLKTKG